MVRHISLSIAIFVAMFAVMAGFASADTGGPDGGGYRFIDSNSARGPAYQFVDISSTGTSAFPGGCDDCVLEDVSLGFTFDFYGTTYNSAGISTNGVLVLGDGHTDPAEYSNETIPTGEFEAAIMVFWDDLDPRCDGSGVFYQSIGAGVNQRFVVQWTSCHYDFGSFPDCVITAQVHLERGTNEVLIFYKDTTFGEGGCDQVTQTRQINPDKPALQPAALPSVDEGASASVGIQESSDTGLQYTYNDERPLTDGLAICFYRDAACGREEETNRPPNIGAGLSGLFAGQPTPLPTAPSAVAPAATAPTISPPRTGDGGLSEGSTTYGFAGAVSFATLLTLGIARVRSKA